MNICIFSWKDIFIRRTGDRNIHFSYSIMLLFKLICLSGRCRMTKVNVTKKFITCFHKNCNAVRGRSVMTYFNRCRQRRVDMKYVTIGMMSSFAILVMSYEICTCLLEETKNRRLGLQKISNSIYGHLKLYRYKDYVIPGFMEKYIGDSGIENFEVRDDDVFVVTFPISGKWNFTSLAVIYDISQIYCQIRLLEFLLEKATIWKISS